MTSYDDHNRCECFYHCYSLRSRSTPINPTHTKVASHGWKKKTRVARGLAKHIVVKVLRFKESEVFSPNIFFEFVMTDFFSTYAFLFRVSPVSSLKV